MHLRFNECKTFTQQKGFKVSYAASVASSLSREQWDDAAKKPEEYSGTLQESRGRSFVTTLYPPKKQTEIMFSLNEPKSKWIHSPIATKQNYV